MSKNFIKIFLLSVLLWVSSALAKDYDQSALMGYRYGPNLSWKFQGNTPVVWGQWLSQAEASVHYVWLEPLDNLDYGNTLSANSSYLKMEASVEVSPFYGGYRAGLGLRPLKINPQIEVSFIYESYFYFLSNLEMVTADVAGGGRIAETWNADYIMDHVGRHDSEFDYAQLFDFGFTLSYMFPHGSVLGMDLHYVLSDISTDFNGKSYDYSRNIPVFSRDFLMECEVYGQVPFNKNFSLLFETSLYLTGFLRNKNTVEKESLSYGLAMMGPHFSWANGFQNITFEVGYFNRFEKRFYDGNLSQQFIVQLEYQGYFSFPFRGHLSK